MTEEKPPANERPVVYRPAQVAKRLGVTVKTLSYMRIQGKIEGTDLGNNLTVYTEEQILAADLSRQKPGPKPGKKRGREIHGQIDDTTTRWRTSGKGAARLPRERLLARI